MKVHYVSSTFMLSFERDSKVLKRLLVGPVEAGIRGQELDLLYAIGV
jgi:hypothetical protein